MTIVLLCLVAVAFGIGYLVGPVYLSPHTPVSQSTTPLHRAINSALIRGYQHYLEQGGELRSCHVEQALRCPDAAERLAALDDQHLTALMTRGYDSDHGHMTALGWLAHSIGFDVRKYKGA